MVDDARCERQDGPTGRGGSRPAWSIRGWSVGTKDKGGSKASKKPAQKDIKQKRAAKRSKKAK
jgi:hypothetical protein